MARRALNAALGLTRVGKPRRPHKPGQPCHPHEIEPGRSVVNDWDAELVERWEDRKVRRARERAEAAHG